jgi:hypothetical protein
LKPAPRVKLFGVELWREGLDATAFSCGMARIDAYIRGDQPCKAMSSFVTRVFVLLEPGSKVIRGYYTLSALGIVFDDLPKKTQKLFARYPQIGATLLGRLGVDRAYKQQLQQELGQNPGLGDFLFADAQRRALASAANEIGSGLIVIDVLRPSEEEIAYGVMDPMGFYLEWGYLPFPGNERRLFKPMRTIAEEEAQA